MIIIVASFWYQAFLFGSRAMGLAVPQSDVDVVIRLGPDALQEGRPPSEWLKQVGDALRDLDWQLWPTMQTSGTL